MKKLLALAMAAALAGCAQSPTGRDQILLLDNSQVAQMGARSFEELKQKEKISTDRRQNAYVQCVAGAITRVLPREQQGSWEVVLFESKSVNAFALPGKKIGVYTGLLQVAENQDQLAAVIGHEVGHVLANHSNERLSQNQLTQVGMALGDAALGMAGVQNRDLWMAGLGVGAQVGVLLPFSRTHESEADAIGLELMAKAGFDPNASVALWRNMARQGSGAPVEFLSTHPSPGTRIGKLQAGIPKVLPSYRAASPKPNCR
ncbi:M48 family metallopeptidase [Gallaecimonas sp. GXIMD4217]|uniref:M48 family metallopeptidase n=1 Tax=Gallaecimonas sp. GXIMD4217 TaxID=3131927 RepID=UPI00311AFC93